MGARESAQSWRELLVELKARGLAVAPELAVGDGALGFWKALEEIFLTTRHRRCWVHKVSNVLNKMPKSMAPTVKSDLRNVWQAETRAAAAAAMDTFAEKHGAKYDKAVACLSKDHEALLAFFDSPAEHWDHLRTANPIETVLATVRHGGCAASARRTSTTSTASAAKTVARLTVRPHDRWADSIGRRNTLMTEVAVTTGKRSARFTRKALLSPGRPPVTQREHRRVSWSAIATHRRCRDPSDDACQAGQVNLRDPPHPRSARLEPDASDARDQPGQGFYLPRRASDKMGIEALYRRPATSKPAPEHKVHPDLLRKDHRPNQVSGARFWGYLEAVINW